MQGPVQTQLTQKPLKYEVTSKITEADIDVVRERKIKDLETKAAKQREKIEIVTNLFFCIITLKIQERLQNVARMQQNRGAIDALQMTTEETIKNIKVERLPKLVSDYTQ